MTPKESSVSKPELSEAQKLDAIRRNKIQIRKRWSNSLLRKHRGVVREVEIKLILPRRKDKAGKEYKAESKTTRFRPERGQAFSTQTIDEILSTFSERLETRAEGQLTFRLVELGLGKFNIIGELAHGEDTTATNGGRGVSDGGGATAVHSGPDLQCGGDHVSRGGDETSSPGVQPADVGTIDHPA